MTNSDKKWKKMKKGKFRKNTWYIKNKKNAFYFYFFL